MNPLRIFILTSLLGHFFYWRIFLRPMAIFFYGAYRGGMLAAMEPDRKLQKLFSTPPPRHYTIPCQSLSIPCAKIYCLTCAVLLWYWQVSHRCLTCCSICAGFSQCLTCAGLCGMRWPLRCLAGACMFSRVVVYALFCMGGLDMCCNVCWRQASSVSKLTLT